jgi:hypothetical protein
VTELFNRKVELFIGEPGEQGLLFTDLKIAFDIKKNRGSNSNTGTIRVYNMNEDSRLKLNDSGLKYDIRAGYLGLNDSPLVKTFSSGDILEVSTERSGPDIVTTLKVGEGTKALADSTLDKSYAEGVPAITILKDLANSLGVAIGTLKDIGAETFNSGYSVSGKSKDRLDSLASKLGLDWSIQNGELNIQAKDGSSLETAVVLSNSTGLLKAYKAKSEKAGEKALGDITKFEALLNPDIAIGRMVQVISGVNNINEFVTVRALRLMGDNKDGPFKAMGDAT